MLEETEIDMDELPAPVIEVGLKPIVTPEGCPLAERATAESKPPVTLLEMVVDPALPCTTETDPGEAERLKPGCVELDPKSALIRLAVGLPHPVTRSYPVVAE